MCGRLLDSEQVCCAASLLVELRMEIKIYTIVVRWIFLVTSYVYQVDTSKHCSLYYIAQPERFPVEQH